MRKQNPLAVFLLSIITFGIYGIFWLARTRGEMVRKGADIPTTWLIIVPIVQLWYYWKWSAGVNFVTKKLDAILVFILILLLGSIGFAIVQDSFNSVADEPVAPAPQPVAATEPVTTSEEIAPPQTTTSPEETAVASSDETPPQNPQSPVQL